MLLMLITCDAYVCLYTFLYTIHGIWLLMPIGISILTC